MFLNVFYEKQNIVLTMHLTMLMAHPLRQVLGVRLSSMWCVLTPDGLYISGCLSEQESASRRSDVGGKENIAGEICLRRRSQ